MKKTIQYFTKEWTREYPVLTQWAWHQAIAHSLDDYVMQSNPYRPIIIDYVNQGLIEIYENKKSLEWYKNQILGMNRKGPGFLRDVLKNYSAIYQEIKTRYLGKTLTLRSFINYLELWQRGVRYFPLFLYTSLDERTPKEVRLAAVKFYNQDKYYAENIPFIKQTLERMFPRLGELSYWILPYEIINNFIPSREELKQRKKNFVLIPNAVQEAVPLDRFLSKRREISVVKPKKQGSSAIMGQTAYPGLVKGKVNVIKKLEQISNFKSGEVMVSPMTMPDYLPAMKKAVAFVTDEGGITCHAAVASRELKKPCVVGTRIATQVFRGGDMVEVDANKGIVRRVG